MIDSIYQYNVWERHLFCILKERPNDGNIYRIDIDNQEDEDDQFTYDKEDMERQKEILTTFRMSFTY